MSDATMAYGMTISIGDGEQSEEFTPIDELRDVSGFDRIIEMKDVSNHASPGQHRERKPNWTDTTPLTFAINYNPDDPGQAALKAANAAKTIDNYQATWSDGEAYQFPAVCTKFGKPAPVDGELVANIELTVTGLPVDVSA